MSSAGTAPPPDPRSTTAPAAGAGLPNPWIRLSEAAVAITMIVAAGALLLVHRRNAHSSPESTVGILVEALASADVARLLDDEALGFGPLAQREIQLRGERAFEQRRDLLARCRSLGEEEYLRLVARRDQLNTLAEEGGRGAFRNLSDDEKYRVWVGKSRDAWLFEKAAISPDHRARIKNPAVLSDRTAYDARVRELGLAALSESERTIAARADSDPALAQDPYVRPVVQRRDAEGRRVLEEALRAFRTAAGRVSPLPPSTSEHRSRQTERERELGRSSLGKDDLAFLDGFRPATDEELPARTLELGLARLSEAERALAAGWTIERLQAERTTFVLTEGRNQFVAFLREQLRTCQPEVAGVTYEGWAPGALVRSWHARVQVNWRPAAAGKLVVLRNGAASVVGLDDPVPHEALAIGHRDDILTWRMARGSEALLEGIEVGASVCEAFLGREFSLYLRSGSWRLAWPELAPPQPPFLPEWVAGTDSRPSGGEPAAPGVRLAALSNREGGASR